MLQTRYGRFLPSFLRRRLMIVEAAIDSSVRSLASQIPDGTRVLDAGAGEAQYADHFAHCRYTGVDLAIGDQQWSYSGLDVIADLTCLPFQDRSFEAAMNIVVLEHVREPARALREIARVLEPGGQLLIVVPQEWEVHQGPNDFYRYTRYGLEWLLEGAGFSKPKVQPIGGYFTLLARRLLNSMNFFQQGLRWLVFPFVAAVSGFLALILPGLDFLDREKNFTLAYVCLAEKS